MGEPITDIPIDSTIPTTEFKLSSITLDRFQWDKHVLNHALSLEHLDLSGMKDLSSLPKDISCLRRLKRAFFSNCSFTVFPKELAACPELEMVAFRSNGMKEIPEDAFPPQLRWLILTNNNIETLPKSIGKCHRLQKCMLAGNQLSSLPDQMSSCKKLGLLRLSANRFETLPAWLFEMPELAFLSFAGNPVSTEAADRSPGNETNLPEVSWSELKVLDSLAEGASGNISRAQWQDGKEVAIKLFKGDVTSDGTPADEMRACILAGSHANLISPLGQILDHPESKAGLVLQLIQPSYRSLGLPPSFLTCTRDNFTPKSRLSRTQGLEILRGAASAAAHLHTRGIAHGDLYAHNILFKENDGHAFLCDFGAASTYVASSYPVERLEVLAFAHLIDDVRNLLLRKGESVEKDAEMLEQLNSLHGRCSGHCAERPRFADVLRDLGKIASS